MFECRTYVTSNSCRNKWPGIEAKTLVSRSVTYDVMRFQSLSFTIYADTDNRPRESVLQCSQFSCIFNAILRDFSTPRKTVLYLTEVDVHGL